MRLIILAVPVALVLAAGACNRSPEEPMPTSSATAEVPAVEEPVEKPVEAPTIWFEPAEVSTCSNAAVKVVVHWNARSVQGIKSVKVHPIGPGGKETLFVHGGPLGNHETGEWMTPGRQMVLRDTDGKELGRAVLKGIPCAQ